MSYNTKISRNKLALLISGCFSKGVLFSSVLVCALVGPLAAISEELTSQSPTMNRYVQVVLQLDGNTDLQTRIRACKSLPVTLGQIQSEMLFEELLELSEEPDPEPESPALFNELLNFFNRLKEPLPNYPQRLLLIIENESKAEVFRDYALQQILAHAEYRLDAEKRRRVLSEAKKLSFEQYNSTLPGTYLLGVYLMSGKEGYASSSEIAQDAYSVASDPSYLVLNRISALQICGQMLYEPALPLVREIAIDAMEDIGLRMSAIATLGNFTSDSDEALLRGIVKSSMSSRLRYAARQALEKKP